MPAEHGRRAMPSRRQRPPDDARRPGGPAEPEVEQHGPAAAQAQSFGPSSVQPRRANQTPSATGIAGQADEGRSG